MVQNNRSYGKVIFYVPEKQNEKEKRKTRKIFEKKYVFFLQRKKNGQGIGVTYHGQR